VLITDAAFPYVGEAASTFRLSYSNDRERNSEMFSAKLGWLGSLLLVTTCVAGASAQDKNMDFLNHNKPVLDAHNCYPYEGHWNDRITRALNSGFPVSIEQDIAWYVDPSTGKGKAVVSHTPKAAGSEPTLRDYFFEQVRPTVEKALAEKKRDQWPLIVLHFDFKDNQPAVLEAVWQLLGEYEPWLSTAVKTDHPEKLSPIDRKPILVITENSDAQAKVFFDNVPVGSKIRVFGAAHTMQPPSEMSLQEKMHWAATVAPEQFVSEAPTNYRRWSNNSWFAVEEGGQSKAGDWTETDDRRLRSLVDHAHKLGYWIRFYTLDGFAQADDQGWGRGYNFGSQEAVIPRWKAAVAAGVNFIATDQYEGLESYMKQSSKELRPSSPATAKR
jgi:hypothetical protein